MAPIALITDYGTRDYYAGALKGVLSQLASHSAVIDITHDIAPHNVTHGAFVIWQSWAWFPEETVFLAVVDPGVGTDRRILAGRYDGRYLVCPDNGLATFLHRIMVPEALHVVTNAVYYGAQVSRTFHGRDILAPVAAHLANGVRLDEFGPFADQPVVLPNVTEAEVRADGVYGSILYVDRFGTLVTNIGRSQLQALARSTEQLQVALDGQIVGPIRKTFAETAIGRPVALFGGCELLEVALNQGSASERFGPVQVVRVFVP